MTNFLAIGLLKKICKQSIISKQSNIDSHQLINSRVSKEFIYTLIMYEKSILYDNDCIIHDGFNFSKIQRFLRSMELFV